MTLERIEAIIRCLGGLIAYTTLGVILYSIWRGARRPPGRTSGRVTGWLRSTFFCLLTTALFLTSSVIFWKPLPLTLSIGTRALSLTAGALIYFPGLAFFLWGRLALGRLYSVSTSLGTQLFADHQLVTRGPFAIVRHPMYLGLIVTALGSLMLYRTWTTAAFAVIAPFLLLRARREEQTLSEEFGEAWQAYAVRVPMFVPAWCQRHFMTCNRSEDRPLGERRDRSDTEDGP